MFKRILVPLDGSNLAEMVLPFTISLAEQLQATLVLFHVVEKNAPMEIHGQRHLREVAAAKAYFNRIAARFSSPAVPILKDVHEVQETGVAQTICDHAEELHTDLIVLCAHGNGGLRDMFLGSIAQQVIRQGNTPVLFIRPEMVIDQGGNLVRHILIPLDGSEEHEVAIPVAAYLAEKYTAKIHLVTVIPSVETLSVKKAITSRVSPRMTTLALNIHAQQAEEYLLQRSQKFARQGITAVSTVLHGDIPTKLIEMIAVEGIDLVVMATHGHNMIDAHWEGNLTPRFLHKSPVPVFLVRGKGRDEE